VILAGPAVLGAWSAARSTVQAGERAVVLAGGPLADQLLDAVYASGAEVTAWPMSPAEFPDLDRLQAVLRTARPTWVGLAYCEPEHAAMYPLPEILTVIRGCCDALVCVDVRAALAAAPLAADAMGIDLCLASADHVLAVPVDAALVTVSATAWRRADAVGYQGWEALTRWRNPTAQPGHPYAPGAHALHALAVSGREILSEGLALVHARHQEVARYARERLRRLDLGPFPADGQMAAPTVTGAYIPADRTWPMLAGQLAEQGVALGLGRDETGDRLALCGHMGPQADLALVKRAIDAYVDSIEQPADVGGWTREARP
jgi:aspartate aminotransferase-like enzyme